MATISNLHSPYKEESINHIYNMLFCDDLDLYSNENKSSGDIFSGKNVDLNNIVSDDMAESRMKLLAYHKMRDLGQAISKKELLGIVIEVGLDNGLDVLASFKDGTARYINFTGKMVVWETSTPESNDITNRLFSHGENILQHIGVWEKPRLTFPETGNAKISLLVSDGYYFGMGPIDALFHDAIAGQTLETAGELMAYLVQMSTAK